MQLFGHSTFQFGTLGCIHEVSNLFGTFNLKCPVMSHKCDIFLKSSIALCFVYEMEMLR